MSFRLSDVATAQTFNDVERLYERTKPFRSHSMGEGVRPLGEARKPYVSLRAILGGYACRYHQTDVVRWQRTSDGDYVTVEGWSSQSTEVFADALTPWNVRFLLTTSNMRHMARVDGAMGASPRVYVFDGSGLIRFKIERGAAVPVEHGKASFIDVDRKKLNLALSATQYHAYRDWLRARVALNPQVPSVDWTDRGIHWLADPAKWEQLTFFDMMAWSEVANPRAFVENKLAWVRGEIYQEYKPVVKKQVEWFPWSEYHTQARRHSDYWWAE